MLPGMACEGVDALAREGEGLTHLLGALLELDSSDSGCFEGGWRDGPAMLVAEEVEEDPEVRSGLEKAGSLSSVPSQTLDRGGGAGGRVIKYLVAFARASFAGPAWGTGTPISSEREVQSAEATRDERMD